MTIALGDMREAEEDERREQQLSDDRRRPLEGVIEKVAAANVENCQEQHGEQRQPRQVGQHGHGQAPWSGENSRHNALRYMVGSRRGHGPRSEEHPSELQSLMRIS